MNFPNLDVTEKKNHKKNKYHGMNTQSVHFTSRIMGNMSLLRHVATPTLTSYYRSGDISIGVMLNGDM